MESQNRRYVIQVELTLPSPSTSLSGPCLQLAAYNVCRIDIIPCFLFQFIPGSFCHLDRSDTSSERWSGGLAQWWHLYTPIAPPSHSPLWGGSPMIWRRSRRQSWNVEWWGSASWDLGRDYNIMLTRPIECHRTGLVVRRWNESVISWSVISLVCFRLRIH